MTKLEEEIDKAMCEADRISSKRFTSADYAKAAAEVAKKYIEKAFVEGYYAVANMDSEEWPHPEKLTGQVLADKWLKENGIE